MVFRALRASSSVPLPNGLHAAQDFGALFFVPIYSHLNARSSLSLSLRQVLLPETVSKSLLVLRGDAGANDPVFASRTGARLKQRAIGYMIKGAARRAGVRGEVSAHWLRHAHGSHSLDRGATLAEVQATLGHTNVATTSGYLHARPNTSSGLKLDEGIFR